MLETQCPMPDDEWWDSSADMIERFLDVFAVRHRRGFFLSDAYRGDLQALDAWLRRFAGHTLVTADNEELVRYMSESGYTEMLRGRQLRAARGMCWFYRWLQEVRCRDDDPMPRGSAPMPAVAGREREIRADAREQIDDG